MMTETAEKFKHEEERESILRIQQLELELERTRQEANNNKAAADILTQMINKGDAEFDETG